MSEMNLLAAVKRVEVPSHLKQQIDDRISNAKVGALPDQWLWLAAASVAVLITVNTFVIRSEYVDSRSSGQTNVLTASMGIKTSNQLY